MKVLESHCLAKSVFWFCRSSIVMFSQNFMENDYKGSILRHGRELGGIIGLFKSELFVECLARCAIVHIKYI